MPALLYNITSYGYIHAGLEDSLATVSQSNTDTSTPPTPIVILSSATTSTMVPPERKSQVLLISISVLSVAIILFLMLVILCLAVALKHIVRPEKVPTTNLPDSVNVYAELEPNFTHDINEEGENWFSGTNQSEEQGIPGDYERIPLS